MAFVKGSLGEEGKVKEYTDGLEGRIDSAFKEVDNKDRKTLMEKGVVSDANGVKETGIYATNSNTKNRPPTSAYGGVIMVLNRDTSTLVQVHFDIVSSGDMKWRPFTSSGTWGAWK